MLQAGCPDGAEQAIGIGQHDSVEILPLLGRNLATLQRFEVKANRCERRFELMRNGVEERVLTLVAADLANEEDRVEDDAGHQQGEGDNSNDEQEEAPLVQDDPTNVKDDRRAKREDTKRDEEGKGSASARDVHGVGQIQPAVLPREL